MNHPLPYGLMNHACLHVRSHAPPPGPRSPSQNLLGQIASLSAAHFEMATLISVGDARGV